MWDAAFDLKKAKRGRGHGPSPECE
jgi:hypothetical protein